MQNVKCFFGFHDFSDWVDGEVYVEYPSGVTMYSPAKVRTCKNEKCKRVESDMPFEW